MKILFFSAPWCAPCKTFKPIVESVCNKKGLPFEMVDISINSALAQQYHVKSVPTVVFINSKTSAFFRLAKASPKADFREWLEALV